MSGLICRFLKHTLHIALRQVSSCFGGRIRLSPLKASLLSSHLSHPPILDPLFSGTKLLSCSWMSAQCCQRALSSLPLPLSPPQSLPPSLLISFLSSLSVQRKNDCKWVPWTTGTPINKTVSQRCRKEKKREGARGTLSLNISSPAPAALWHPTPIARIPIPPHHPLLLMPSTPFSSMFYHPSSPDCPLSYSPLSPHSNQGLPPNNMVLQLQPYSYHFWSRVNQLLVPYRKLQICL